MTASERPLRPPPGSSEVTVERWRPVALDALVSGFGLPTDRTAVIAVDGRGAGGKSTLAGRLATAIDGSAVLHTDDLAWNYSILGWDGVLVEHVLGPVRRGEAVRYRPPGWVAERRPGAVEIAAARSVLIVEGVGAGRRELGVYVDATVWVQSDWDDAYERGITRDVEQNVAGRNEAESREFWDLWMAEELPFLEEQAVWRRADAVVAGQRVIPLGPDEVAVALPSVG